MQQPLLYGIRVYSSPLAEHVSHHWEVKKHPIKKRRRSWRPVRIEVRKPVAHQTPMVIFMHPTLLAQLKRELGKYTIGAAAARHLAEMKEQRETSAAQGDKPCS